MTVFPSIISTTIASSLSAINQCKVVFGTLGLKGISTIFKFLRAALVSLTVENCANTQGTNS